ncbi:MAG: tRNA (adenosine(37)-N6)-dimethylallyltransferase MiaA [Nitrospirota bacterium]|nr:tRNA (adenosine(37)-N6)-dimethylallyltransferase MiaA [Nitrospirota bacterium]
MNKVLILLGPTGVGKTGASILLAEKLDTEIISADSMQIYRNMDIGTAKPAKEEMKAVRHHMIDIIPPTESYSVGQYIETVVPVIDRIQGEGRIPVIVGGTGLYIKAITRGIFSGPSADWALRDELLSAEQAEKGYLFAYLQETDPEASEKIDRNDTRRIVRAIEVCLKSREKISLLQKRLTKPLSCEFIKIGLTRERGELYGIIEKRVDGMIQAGLQEETENILKMDPDKTPMQAIGYKEIAMYLDEKITMEEAVTLVKRNSRRYAKRQFTWFRKEEAIKWIDVTGIHDSMAIFNLIKDVIAGSYPDIPFRK